ncbi:chymotrypsin BII isoform X2 [Nilaparvata lugens]|nr:chymotrypsin BII isoform X2 [Nilaparvata lugens]
MCLTGEQCFSRGGQLGKACRTMDYYCCSFMQTCGDTTRELVSYFRSPDYPARSSGTLACDFDLIIQDNICAVRIDFEKVNLARKSGGYCDIDQIFIMNSVDGPTTGQCGPLSGYTTIVAVDPGQSKPLKLAVVIQNENHYRWLIKLMQIPCHQIQRFNITESCGRRNRDQNATVDLIKQASHPLSSILLWWNAVNRQSMTSQWWDYPEPVYNSFYYKSTKLRMRDNEISVDRTQAERRIVSGTDANVHEFPWTAAIGVNHKFFCGGALISDLFVLTAAHCFLTRNTHIETIVVHLGDHDLTTENETHHTLRGVSRIFFHSHFHAFLLANDIALLQLDEPVTFSVAVQPVCLPRFGDSFTDEKATVVGWGVASVSLGIPSPTLQKLQVEIIDNKECTEQIKEKIGNGIVCARPPALEGTCFGDSGGPLTVEDVENVSTLVGIVSFGVTGCAVIPAFPDLYTRISEYVNWIDVNTM